MPWTIHVMIGTREIGAYPVDEQKELVIGRDGGCSIVVNDRSVSRRHCTARKVEGGIELVDLGAANGLYFGGRLLKRVVLREGDQCNLGMARLIVRRSGTNHTGMIPVGGLLESLNTSSSSSSSGGTASAVESSFPGRELGSESGIAFLRGAVPPSSSSGRANDPSSESLSSSFAGRRREYEALEKDRLAILIETGKSLGQSTDLEHLLNKVMDHLFEILPVCRAAIALTEDGENFEARCVRPVAQSEEISHHASKNILRQVVQSHQGVIIEDAALDQKLRSNQSVILSNIRAAVCVPILANNRCLGAIYADYPGRARLYTNADLDFLTAFASIAAISLENARMMRQLRDDERLKRDLEIAAEIQQGILPNEAFEFDGLEIDWAYWPSLQIGGDFYDVIPVEGGRIAVILGDVSGKSVPAALYMARTLSFLRATLMSSQTPGEVLTRTNFLLGDSAERVLLSTTFVMIIDPKSRQIQWSNAGHNPALVRNPLTGDFLLLDANGPPLGFSDDQEYPTEHLEVGPGTMISLYTDGLTEVRDLSGEFFGIERVQDLVSRHADRPVTETTKSMISAIELHSKGSSKHRDDVAIVNIRVL